ncbi:MAG TPA: phosphoribosylformylglycinamidine synthase subunit PurL [Actinomycetota bacterium]|nr:phosphoribosylformylglycinamidine synthase subunit PurL [Actinomycetota bacterium]
MTTATRLHRELGLSDDELHSIVQRLGREPTHTELAMFSVMWSEHCSYKSSRVHLRKLPTEGPQVLVGPGEGAGIVEVAPGTAVAWKVESHNHPSFVEPFNGAATGVGGIVRDILSMGARPIALMDPLRFGDLHDARTRYLVDGVVDGISSYGNSIGVPTVGGETVFEDCYAENPLVNVACLGVIEDRVMQGAAAGEGNLVVLVGSSTGRDGIGGASVLASAEFDDDSATKRPSVQVGDPLTEKLLIECCLELFRDGLVTACQDLGAGGISCPASEMSSKGRAGMHLDLDKVRRREPGMEPFEVMISESQERMMLVVRPGDLDEVLSVCRRWEVPASVIGEISGSGNVEVSGEGDIVADVPAHALAEEGPIYERDMARPAWIDSLQSSPPGDEAPTDIEEAFFRLLTSPGIASKRWVWEQYDHMIFLGTAGGPGGDAAVIRLPGRDVAVAISVDGPGRFCYLDPYEGARLAVAEAARNVVCAGGKPLAVTNCLNFGNPEKPEVMWQFAEVVRGLSDACTVLETPVTGGNVSFYNETNGRAIYPTPVIGMLGALESVEHARGIAFSEGDSIVLLGETRGDDFGGSEYAKRIHSTVAGRPPRLDLDAELKLHRVILEANRRGAVAAAHDVSEGGLAIAIAESAIAGGVGARISLDAQESHRKLFAESPSRAIVACSPERMNEVLDIAGRIGCAAGAIGTAGGSRLDFGTFEVDLVEAARAFEDALPAALSARV